MSDDTDEGAQTLEGAREVLLRVAASPEIASDHTEIAAACDLKTLQRIADLAWRHQFEDDRNPFKRDIRELQEHVVRLAIDKQTNQ
jgi:hypothetical protein